MFETTQYNPNNLDLEELLNFNFGELAAILTPFVHDNTDYCLGFLNYFIISYTYVILCIYLLLFWLINTTADIQ